MHFPYTLTIVMDVWECDLLDVQAYAKYNDYQSYIRVRLDRIKFSVGQHVRII